MKNKLIFLTLLIFVLILLSISFVQAQVGSLIPPKAHTNSQLQKVSSISSNPTSINSALLAGADYVKNLQSSTDGGWDWVLTAPVFVHSSSVSEKNLYGVCALGLYYAYLKSGDEAYMTAMKNAADYMIADVGIKDASALKFLMLYNDLPGVSGSAYKDAARIKYDAQILAHGTANTFAEYIRDNRGIAQGYHNGIIAWDLGAWAIVAKMLYDRFSGSYLTDAADIANVAYNASFVTNTNYFDLARCAGWDATYTNVDFYWYNLGVCGLLDAFVASGTHNVEIPSLIQKLKDSQAPSGAVCGSYGIHDGDEDWQSTAYAVMSLANLDASLYAKEIGLAACYLANTQDVSGGWLYVDGTHYPEVGGENTTALYFGYYSLLPVEMVTFTATLQGTNTTLKWSTATEVNNYGFEIERRETTIWAKIGFIAGAGTSNAPRKYSYSDNNLSPGHYFYRVKQIDNDGTFSYHGSAEVVVVIETPKVFALEQNYPNPFNPGTTINYQIPTAGFVNLKVYDILGKEVATLVNEQKNAGKYSVSFNASSLASGTYFYKISAVGFMQIKKMVSLK